MELRSKSSSVSASAVGNAGAEVKRVEQVFLPTVRPPFLSGKADIMTYLYFLQRYELYRGHGGQSSLSMCVSDEVLLTLPGVPALAGIHEMSDDSLKELLSQRFSPADRSSAVLIFPEAKRPPVLLKLSYRTSNLLSYVPIYGMVG